jgi:hypothetical protein
MRYSEKREVMCRRALNIFTVDNQLNNRTFSSLSLTNFTPNEIRICFEEDPLFTGLLMVHWWKRSNYSASLSTHEKLHINSNIFGEVDYRFQLTHINEIRSLDHVYMPNAIAPLIQPTASSRAFCEQQELIKDNKFQRFVLEGKYS